MYKEIFFIHPLIEFLGNIAFSKILTSEALWVGIIILSLGISKEYVYKRIRRNHLKRYIISFLKHRKRDLNLLDKKITHMVPGAYGYFGLIGIRPTSLEINTFMDIYLENTWLEKFAELQSVYTELFIIVDERNKSLESAFPNYESEITPNHQQQKRNSEDLKLISKYSKIAIRLINELIKELP